MSERPMLDLLLGVGVICVAFVPGVLALSGVTAWGWPWWAVTVCFVVSAVGIVAWVAGVRGGPAQ